MIGAGLGRTVARAVRDGIRDARPMVAARDALINRRWRHAEPGILVVRHAAKTPWFYREFLDWMALNFPEVRSRFTLSMLDGIGDPSRFRLLVPWLQDPVQHWSPPAYDQACSLADRFEARGVPVINPPAALTNAAKSHTLATARSLGIRAARTASAASLDDLPRAASDLGFPFIIRPDWGHGQQGVRVAGQADLRACDSARLAAMETPLAIQFIDTTGPDGLYRKYRYLAAGDQGVNVHLLVSAHWEVRGDCKIMDRATMAEELAFITAPNPHAHVFNRLRRALELDLVAFDYGHDRDGNLVVWEANPYPKVAFGADSPALRYRSLAVHRCYAAMACLYLARAHLEIPPDLAALVDDPVEAAARYPALARPESILARIMAVLPHQG